MLKSNKFNILSALAIITLVFSCWIFCGYVDMVSLTAWTVEIWDSLFAGRINEYFLVTAENMRMAPHGGNMFGILYLIPWAIWNFPIFLFDKNYLTGGGMSEGSLFWSRLFLCLCAIITAYYCMLLIRKITNNIELSKMAFFYTITSCSLLLSISYFGQDEIVYTMLLMIGIYYLVCDNKLLGYSFMIITVIMFNLMIIPVLAIFLLCEKNIIKIIILTCIGFIPDRIISVIFGSKDWEWLVNSDDYATVTDYNNFSLAGIVKDFFYSNSIKIGTGIISFFAIFIILIFAYCYFINLENNKLLLLLIPTIITLVICLLPSTACYRHCMVVPLIACSVLIIGNEKQDLSVGLFLLTAYSFLDTLINISSGIITNICIRAQKSNIATNTRLTICSFFPEFEQLDILIASAYLSTVIIFIYYLYFKRNRIEITFPKKLIHMIYIFLPISLVVSLCIWDRLIV